ncbi:MAG: hypothetical protein H0S85_11140 [Desulfovibrionaceae bacterium]|jgi:hypothetical protein|nr:hypothetical protein [Desulfovibrionaceae bacterium]
MSSPSRFVPGSAAPPPDVPTLDLPDHLALIPFAPRHLLALRAAPEPAGERTTADRARAVPRSASPARASPEPSAPSTTLHWCGGAAAAGPMLALRGPALTLTAHGHVAACAGVALFWPGVGEGWCAPSAWALAHPLSFNRAARAVLEHLARTAGLHRLQAHVLAHDRRALRWIAWLGFEPEGECPGYGPYGENVIRFRRLFTCRQ